MVIFSIEFTEPLSSIHACGPQIKTNGKRRCPTIMNYVGGLQAPNDAQPERF